MTQKPDQPIPNPDPKRQKVERILSKLRKQYPKAPFCRPVTKAQREEVLGYGPHGF
jgi:hypothetical protein